MDLGDALAWLDRHQNMERMLADHRSAVPDLARMRHLVDVLGNPEAAAPVIGVTGTNGKTSTARAVTGLLMARGLSVGTFTSPHLQAINERIATNGEPIGDDDLARVLTDIAAAEPLVSDSLTWFEVLTAAGLMHFADQPVDVMVLEVGMGGRWDATNVANAAVGVITTIGLDHTEMLGPTRADIAREKVGIVGPNTTLVLGERDPALRPIFDAEGGERVWAAGQQWDVTRNDMAVGGRSLDLRTPTTEYRGLWLDLHGRHQADNFAAAVTAVEAFFDTPTPEPLVRSTAASLRAPGRMEVVGRHPLVLLDGAKNTDGAHSAAVALAEEFGDRHARIYVVGMLQGKDPAEMLTALGVAGAALVVTCRPPSPRAADPEVLAAAAAALGVPAQVASSVEEALDVALRAASSEDLVLVAGSLYVVGAARAVLGAPRP